jgi:hypothetical protein
MVTCVLRSIPQIQVSYSMIRNYFVHLDLQHLDCDMVVLSHLNPDRHQGFAISALRRFRVSARHEVEYQPMCP